MGLDLTLKFDHPMWCNPPDMDPPLLCSSLALRRHHKLFVDIKALESTEIKAVEVYEEGGLTKRTMDNYGDMVTWVTCGQMATITPPQETCQANKAIWALLRAMPADIRVYLWWY